MLGYLLLNNNFLTVLVGKFQEGSLHAYLLYSALCNDIVFVHVKQLVLD